MFHPFLDWLQTGFTGAGFWGMALYFLVVTQLTIFSVTLYLHRSQAHRGVDFHPVLNHFFRFWTWLTTAMRTKEWVAIHRKHHAHCETEDDPHSPQFHGINQVLWRGVELYQHLLEEAIAELRSGADSAAAEEEWTPQIAIGMPVLIPEAYVADLSVRLGLYRRIATLMDRQEIDGFAAEMIDRFGPLPEEVENLLQIVAIKRLCRQAGIDKVDAGPKGAVLSFRNNSFANPGGLVQFISRQAGSVQLRPDHKLVCKRPWGQPDKRVAGLNHLLGELAKIAA